VRTANLLLALWLLPAFVSADTITLNNGRVIEADRTWFQGTQILYEKDGGVYGLPRSLVRKLDQRPAPEASADSDLRRARERLSAGDPVEATRLLLMVLARDPYSVPALHALTDAYMTLGDVPRARNAAERAVRIDDRNPRSRALLADVLVALGDRAGAEAQYRKSLQLHPDAEVQRKLSEVEVPPVAPARGAQFRIRYDGGINEPLGMVVLKTLTQAYDEYLKRLGFGLDDPVTVVLQTEAAFQDGQVPEWAAGVNDGTIRVPVRGLDRLTPAVVGVLRHELAHSFIAARTGGNCPTWLQEGVSQLLEGGEPTRQDVAVAAAVRKGRLIPLLSLEAPFQSLSEPDAVLAYAESLSAVNHVVRIRGELGIVRLLSALADRLPSEEALPVALALSYSEFQKSWEQAISGTTAGTNPR
jgi:tetratricopeptide (TPR) repeat protein